MHTEESPHGWFRGGVGAEHPTTGARDTGAFAEPLVVFVHGEHHSCSGPVIIEPVRTEPRG